MSWGAAPTVSSTCWKPPMRERQRNRLPDGAVAYVLKGFPRLSETFIASEIHRLEQAGLRLRLFVIKPAEESACHPVVDRIRARPDYLPATTSLSKTPLRRWLAINRAKFDPALRRTVRRCPVGLARAAAAALAQAIRARRRLLSRPKKVYFKEFLLAVALADRLLAAPDVRHLHAHFAHGATTVTWLAAMITGLPFSFTAHAKDVYCASLNPAGLLCKKLAAARFVVTCTEANRAYLQQLAPGAAIHRVYHGLNADFARLLAEAPALPPANGHLRVLGVGRLVPKKGFDVFIEACGILHDRGLSFEAAIVGEDGEHGEEVRRLIRARGLERRVTLAGPLSQAALFEEYRRASVFCLTCRVVDDGDRDGIPNVLIEAMAGGLPVVSTGISGIPELVTDRINGVLVPPEDPHTVADAILCLHQHPMLASRLAREAEVTVRERFDGDANARRLVALFRQVVL